jgi:hypothetical protein
MGVRLSVFVLVLGGACTALNNKPLGDGGQGAGAGAAGASPDAGGGDVGASGGAGHGDASAGAGGGTPLDAAADSGLCTPKTSRCAQASLQTCGDDGRWKLAETCPAHQACTGADGAAACACAADATCTVAGPTCSNPMTLMTCAKDGAGCAYAAAASSTCQNGACGGDAGSAACCTNACMLGQGTCLSPASANVCAPGSNGCGKMTVMSCRAGTVCDRIGPPGCADTGWARWRMPNGSVDVAAGAPNPESYTDNGDGTVTDNVTGLMWQQGVLSQDVAQTAANAACGALRIGGYTDWRLPSLVELVSLLDDTANTGTAAINPIFSQTPLGGVCSSTLSADDATFAVFVDFRLGETFEFSASSPLTVRCVR